MSHETLETLSAIIDGELSDADTARARAHLSSCAACASALKGLERASSAFKRSGVRDEPAGLAARVRAGAAPARAPLFGGWAPALAGVAALALVLGTGAKRMMPTLFNNVQQMITGAASTMGSGGDEPAPTRWNRFAATAWCGKDGERLVFLMIGEWASSAGTKGLWSVENESLVVRRADGRRMPAGLEAAGLSLDGRAYAPCPAR